MPVLILVESLQRVRGLKNHQKDLENFRGVHQSDVEAQNQKNPSSSLREKIDRQDGMITHPTSTTVERYISQENLVQTIRFLRCVNLEKSQALLIGNLPERGL